MRSLAFLLALSALAAAPASLFAAAASINLQDATVEDINKAFAAGTLTSEELVRRYLARIEAYNKQGPALRAVIAVAPNALERARELDAERKAKGPRSPLHGIPIVVKDTVDTIDAPTSGGAIGYADTYPLDDSTVIRKLKAAGALVIAKGNLDEFNRGSEGLSSLGGQTLNPYDLTRNPGGSSSGPGVAVNVGFAAIGVATETGASIRSPASNNSLVALAPSEGLISRAGILPISYTQDRAGPHARTVYDAALLATYMRGFDAEDLLTHSSLGRISPEPYTSALRRDGLRGARIGVLRDLFRQGPEFAEINGLIEKQIEVLKKEGAVVLDGLSTGTDLVAFFPMARASSEEFYESFRAYAAQRGNTLPYPSMQSLYDSGKMLEKLKPGVALTLKTGSTEFDALYLAKLKNRGTIRALLVDLMDRHELDALVYPFKSMSAPPIGTGDRGPRDNPVSAITGLPALVVPAGFNSENLPISIEFLGRLYSEPVLFRFGYAYEQATLHRRSPSLTPPLAGEQITY